MRFDLLLALVTFMVGLGFEVSGMSNILFASVLWIASWLLLARAFLAWGLVADWTPAARATTVVLASCLVAVWAWPPIAREFTRQYGPPSFPFVVPGPRTTDGAWHFVVQSRGDTPVFNTEIVFEDLDRIESWKADTSGAPLSSAEMDRGRGVIRFLELGGVMAQQFPWVPFNQARSNFAARSSFRGGRGYQTLAIARVPEHARGEYAFSSRVSDAKTGRIWLECEDPEFPGHDAKRRVPRCFPDTFIPEEERTED